MEQATRASLGARIRILEGCGKGTEFTVDRFPVILGRGDEADLKIPDDPANPTLSRKHLRLSVASGRLSVQDISTNGCTVRKRLMHPGEPLLLGEEETLWLGPQTQVHIQTLRSTSTLVAKGTFRLRVLGTFEAAWQGQAITDEAWETRKPIVLLVYLAWQGARPVAPDRLCADLWPDHPQGGRQALQSTLGRLRRALRSPGLEPVLFERGAYRINPDLGLDFDAIQLSEALAKHTRSSLQDARCLYGGSFLEGFNEDWVCLRRQDLEQLFHTGMARLAQLLCESGEYQEALAVYQEVLRMEPCWEPGHQGSVAVLMSLGQRDEAVRHYHRYVETMKTQLGLSASPEMLRWYYSVVS